MRRVLEVIKLIDALGAIQSIDVFTVVCEASSQHLLYLPPPIYALCRGGT